MIKPKGVGLDIHTNVEQKIKGSFDESPEKRVLTEKTLHKEGVSQSMP